MKKKVNLGIDAEIGEDVVERKLIRAIARSTPVVKFDKDEKYFPTSFEYFAKHCSIEYEGKTLFREGSDREIGERIVNEFDTESKTDNSVPIIWSRNCHKMNELLMNVGVRRGYAGVRCCENKLHGDIPHYITAYSSGMMECRHSNVKFCDVTFTIYFMWNGTSHFHACDMEEITVRYQYGEGSAWNIGYNRIRDHGIVKDQGVLNRKGWYVARIFLSAHGRSAAFPTRHSGRKTIKVKFEKSRIVVYSALESHAIYAAPGVKKRIFGFGNDIISKEGGLEWRPSSVVLWMPMVTKESGRLSDPLIIDVSGKEIPIRATPKTHPFYYLSFFRGKIGNEDNSQVPVPFKNGVTNLMSDGEFSYKFQHGGLESAVDQVMSIRTQYMLLMITGIAFFLSLLGQIVLSAAVESIDNVNYLFPILGFVASISLSFFVLLFFVGNRS